MTVKQEIREERNDVYSFWELKKQVNEINDSIIEVDGKIDETTLIDLQKRIFELQKDIEKSNDRLMLENIKLGLINSLK